MLCSAKTKSVIVHLGSNRECKVDATKKAFGLFFSAVEAVPCEVASGVRSQPFGAEETEKGALNRARAALEASSSRAKPTTTPHAEQFCVGIENGVIQVGDDGQIVDRACVVVHHNGQVHTIWSSPLALPTCVYVRPPEPYEVWLRRYHDYIAPLLAQNLDLYLHFSGHQITRSEAICSALLKLLNTIIFSKNKDGVDVAGQLQL